MSVLGRVAWQTKDATGWVLGCGENEYGLRDLRVTDLSGGGMRMSRLELGLDSDFRWGMARSLEPERGGLSGFGLTADREDEPTFSWEWFTVAGPRAHKLQETGELAIETTDEDGVVQVTRTEFLTDVSLRILRFGPDSPPNPSVSDWRIDIARGSWVRWPSASELGRLDR